MPQSQIQNGARILDDVSNAFRIPGQQNLVVEIVDVLALIGGDMDVQLIIRGQMTVLCSEDHIGRPDKVRRPLFAAISAAPLIRHAPGRSGEGGVKLRASYRRDS